MGLIGIGPTSHQPVTSVVFDFSPAGKLKLQCGHHSFYWLASLLVPAASLLVRQFVFVRLRHFSATRYLGKAANGVPCIGGAGAHVQFVANEKEKTAIRKRNGRQTGKGSETTKREGKKEKKQTSKKAFAKFSTSRFQLLFR